MAAPLLLSGLSALITGAATGIGRHTALAFVKHGIARLALADCDLETLTAFVNKLKIDWPEVDVVPLHVGVRKSGEVKEAVGQAFVRFGRLDIAVNNAGVGGQGNVGTHELDESEWQRVVDVNLNGVFRCQKEELASMSQVDLGPRQGRGTIVNVASMFGIVGPPSPMCQSAYATTKHGVMDLTKADANTYADAKIRINAICTGYTSTRMTGDQVEAESRAAIQSHIARVPLKRMAMLEEIADSIVFLASPMSSFMLGAALVDGGFTSLLISNEASNKVQV